jgi:alpha-L-rhamnosidase
MKNLLATAYWADDAAKMARMAKALGRDDESKRFETMFARVRAAFQKEFVRDGGRLTVETQTAYLLALAFDLLPEDARPLAAARLVENIRALDWHLSTGFIGISHLNPILTLHGHADVAYRLLFQETYPSWLYPVRHGATTIWERWNGWTHEEGFFVPQMNSFNHYSLGSVGEWLFRHVAGIELDPDVPGFQRFVLRPYPGSGIEHARAVYRTTHGEIESSWRLHDDIMHWTIRVPPNTTARVFIPCDADTDIAAVDTDGIRVIERDDAFLACEAAAGTYNISTPSRCSSRAAEGGRYQVSGIRRQEADTDS